MRTSSLFTLGLAAAGALCAAPALATGGVPAPPAYAPPAPAPPAYAVPAPRPAAPPRAYPAPPARPLMSRREAVSSALAWCDDRRMRCSVEGARLDGEVWLVDVAARRGRRRHAELQLGFDAFSRELVAVSAPDDVGPQPLPPPPPPRPMTFDEASRRGVEYCRSRGYACRVEEAKLVPGENLWRVRLAALPPGHGKVRLDVDALTRSVVEAREHLR